MTALKWTIMLLAFHLMGLFYSKSITAAPIYNSDENQLSGMTDSTLVHMNDDDISDTHEINTHNGGNDHDVNGVAEKGKDRTSSKEGQEFGNETESGSSVHENFAISPNSHGDGDMARSQSTSNEEENKEDNNKASSIEDDNVSSEGHVHKESGPVENSDDGGHVNHEEAHDQVMDTGVASEDEADTGVAHDVEEYVGAAHEDNEDNGAVHGKEVDTGAAHDVEDDTGAAHDEEADTGVAHDVEDDTGAAHEHNGDTEAAHEDNEVTDAAHDEADTGAAHDVKEDTGAAHEDNEDVGAAHEGDVDTTAAHDVEEDTGATHEDNEGTGPAQGADEVTGKAYDIEEDGGAVHDDEEDAGAAHEDNEDNNEAHEGDVIGAGHNNEEQTFTENDHKEDYDAEHVNEEDFHTEYVHKENHIAGYEDKGKYTAVSHGAFKVETTKTNGTNDKGLAPLVHHEEATAGLEHRVITQHTHATGNSNESSGDQSTEGRDMVDISNSVVKTMNLHKNDDATYGPIDEGEGTKEEEEKEEDKDKGDEEDEEDGDNSDYGAKTDNSGVEEDSSGRMLVRKEDKNNDDINLKEGDSNTDTFDTHRSLNIKSFMGKSGSSEKQSLNVERIRELEETTLKPSAEIEIEHIQPIVISDVSPGNSIASNGDKAKGCNCSNNETDISERREAGHKYGDNNKDKPDDISTDIVKIHVEEENSVSNRTDEYNVTKSVTGCENCTVVSGPQLQKEEIRRQGADGINEPGHVSQSQDSEYSQSSTGSFVVLGIIMGTIVVLLGYSVFKSRWRNTQEAKNEDFGTEMADVKKNLLPRNEFSDGIHPTIYLEADESNTKLLSDTQYKGNNAKSEGTHKIEAGIADYGCQNQKNHEGYDGSHPKQEIDFDRIETQSEPSAPDNTLKFLSQESSKLLSEDVITKKMEPTEVQCARHPLKPQKAPDNTSKSYSQESTNHYPEVFIENKLEISDVQCAHHPVKPQEAPDNTSKSHSQECTDHFPQLFVVKKLETADIQCVHLPVKPEKAPDNTFKPHSQESTNYIPEVFIAKKLETADVQCACHPLKPQEASDNTNNTTKSHSQGRINHFSEVSIGNRLETADVQCVHPPLKPQEAPDNTSRAHAQENTNNFLENVITKKVETADVQSSHDSSHQNGLNNANVVSEVAAETLPSVPSQNN